MRILADANVPDEHVSALRGDGYEVHYARDVPSLGPEAPDGTITAYAEKEGVAARTAARGAVSLRGAKRLGH